MAAGAQDILQILILLGLISPNMRPEDFREPDDGIERGPQLVRHAGQELGLVAIRDLELAPLLLDFLEQRAFCRASADWWRRS